MTTGNSYVNEATPSPTRQMDAARSRLMVRLVPYLALGILVLVTALSSYRASQQGGYRQLDDSALLALDLYAYTLESELARFAYLPTLLEADSDILALMHDPMQMQLREAANQKLARFSVVAGTMEISVIDPQGEPLASSHAYRRWPSRQQRDPAWLINQVHGPGVQRFFAADTETGSPSYFFVHPVEHRGQMQGVIALRVSLDPLEATWADLSIRSESEELLVVDDNGVVVMSSVSDWRYRTLDELSAEELQRLKILARYPSATLKPLALTHEETIERGARLVWLPRSPQAPARVLRAAQERPLATLGWRLMILSDPTDVKRNAAYVAFGSAAVVAFFCLLVIYLWQRRRTLRQLFAARRALEKVNSGLASMVAQRTQALEATNTQLLQEMRERQLAEQELIQAGKLAVLGQMSVGIAHEISQPLTALRALSNNTTVLLQQGRSEEAMQNLVSLADVVTRMGRITTELKSFARRAPEQKPFEMSQASPVLLQTAIANVCSLLEHRTRQEQVEIIVDVPDGMQVHCDVHKLEQVLINLAGNALDAMKDSIEKKLRFFAHAKDGRACICVSDTGPPVPDAVVQRLFEPFFSTKTSGEGLGLGLVISSSIVREFGGQLRVSKAESGLIFEFDAPMQSQARMADV